MSIPQNVCLESEDCKHKSVEYYLPQPKKIKSSSTSTSVKINFANITKRFRQSILVVPDNKSHYTHAYCIYVTTIMQVPKLFAHYLTTEDMRQWQCGRIQKQYL
ncbi:hypothetical protein PR048_019725 [Dryococelus australis]|uniref:Uncharacterized protein n=1 Tax=Dryococelus australis TaxID=614101 RepID=A0ABQ9H495_9NEOP|nr:hypothetical protein PR048_019725 [Dryococelus australis]